jgi:hypothetical protein
MLWPRIEYCIGLLKTDEGVVDLKQQLSQVLFLDVGIHPS